MQLNDFSVVSTNVELNTKINIIKKTYSKNVEIDITTIELKELMDDYINSLKVSNITIPEIVSSYIQDEKIIYECEFCGNNIVQAGLTMSNFDEFIPSEQILIYVPQKLSFFVPHNKKKKTSLQNKQPHKKQKLYFLFQIILYDRYFITSFIFGK